MKHNKATDRMARLIAAIPWIVARDGALVDDIAERFDYPRDLLLDDLENVVFFVGVPPYTPDTLIEVQIDDDMVWIRYADWFSRPMRLTSAESLALLAAGETALAFDKQDNAGPLARGLTKLRLATGAEADVLDIQIGTSNNDLLAVLRGAHHESLCVDISYYSFGRDEQTERRIEPQRFFVDAGNWYISGYCHLAGAQRVFRLDRIKSANTTTQAITKHAATAEQTFDLDMSARATLRVPMHRLRVLDGATIDTIKAGDDPLSREVILPVTSNRWLEQLMIRLGPEATILEVTNELNVQPVAAARQILHRYKSAESPKHSADSGR